MRCDITRGFAAALVAGALACGISADALAVPVVGADAEYSPSGSDSDVQAGSDIAMYSSVGQMRVSVPTNVAIALQYDGGFFAGPDKRTQENASTVTDKIADEASGTYYRKANSGYGIENHSSFDVYIIDWEGSTKVIDPETGVEKPTGFSLNKGIKYLEDGSITFDTENTTEGYISDLYVELVCDSEKHWLTLTSLSKEEGLETPLHTPDAIKVDLTRHWKIAAATLNESNEIVPTVFGIDIRGANSAVTAPIPDSAVKAQHAFTIKWTISARSRVEIDAAS